MTTDAGFDETPDPAGLAAPPPTPGRFDQVRARASKRNLAIGCGGLLFMCGGCFYLLPTPDPEPSQPRGFMSTTEATEAEPPTAKPTDEPIEAATARPEATETKAPTEAPTETPEPTAAPTSTPEPTLPPPTATPAIPDLNPDQDRDCNEFANREQAQAYWEHYRNPGRPNPGRLDGNSNGIVCEDPDRSAREVAPAPQPQPAAAQPSRPCDTSLKCTDFGSKAEMLAWWNACGRPSKYDKNGDGDPCESLR